MTRWDKFELFVTEWPDEDFWRSVLRVFWVPALLVYLVVAPVREAALRRLEKQAREARAV